MNEYQYAYDKLVTLLDSLEQECEDSDEEDE
jgi:hypothetical protein